MEFKTTLSISGMTCGHCERAITTELSEIPGVESVSVHLVPDGISTVTVESGQALDKNAVGAIITEEGYDLVGFVVGS